MLSTSLKSIFEGITLEKYISGEKRLLSNNPSKNFCIFPILILKIIPIKEPIIVPSKPTIEPTIINIL